jgi:hypothetical protein
MNAVSYIVSARASSLYDSNLANNELKLGVWIWGMEGVFRYITCHIEACQLDLKTRRIEVHLERICGEAPVEGRALPDGDCCPRRQWMVAVLSDQSLSRLRKNEDTVSNVSKNLEGFLDVI